jgi:hypothetical protein
MMGGSVGVLNGREDVVELIATHVFVETEWCALVFVDWFRGPKFAPTLNTLLGRHQESKPKPAKHLTIRHRASLECFVDLGDDGLANERHREQQFEELQTCWLDAMPAPHSMHPPCERNIPIVPPLTKDSGSISLLGGLLVVIVNSDELTSLGDIGPIDNRLSEESNRCCSTVSSTAGVSVVSAVSCSATAPIASTNMSGSPSAVTLQKCFTAWSSCGALFSTKSGWVMMMAICFVQVIFFTS